MPSDSNDQSQASVELDRSPRAASAVALLLTAPVPTLGVLITMFWFPNDVWAKALFFLAKVWLFTAPLLWLVCIEKTKPRIPRWTNKGMGLAVITGSLIFVIIAIAYFTVGRQWIDIGPMREKIEQMNLDNRWLYLAGALYWCTINSLLEEYFWRWFIYTRMRRLMLAGWAIVLAAAAFTAHHVFALSVYFDWRVTILASVGVFIGGATWSWLYAKCGNIYAAYISHVFADIIIFAIGYWLIFLG